MNFFQIGNWIVQVKPAKKGSLASKIGNTIGFLIIVIPIILMVIGHYSK